LRKLKSAVITLLCAVILTGCSMQSEDEAVKSTEETAEKVFNAEKAIETNQELDAFSMYLPKGFEIIEEDASNVIIEDGEQTYIVFYNNLENPLSTLNYESTAAKKDQALLFESFDDTNKFGYTRILPDDEEHYELQAGIGGVKITTYTSKSDMESDAEKMMKIARSIVVDNQDSAQN